jgi:hypothetical protein
MTKKLQKNTILSDGDQSGISNAGASHTAVPTLPALLRVYIYTHET